MVTSLLFISRHFPTLHSPFFTCLPFWTFRYKSSKTLHFPLFLNKQLDAEFFIRLCLFQSSTCFVHSSADHQESQLYHYDIRYMSLYVGDRLVCIPDGHLHRVTYTVYLIDTIDSPDDEHVIARNM